MPRSQSIRIEPGKRFTLGRVDPDDTGPFRGKSQAQGRLQKDLELLPELQYRLYADGAHAVLVVLQAIDTGGKDGVIRHVMSGLNPAGCAVTSFKVPSAEERAHDFLWRIHKAVPPLGVIGVFNRSHYEDVLAVRVHKLVPEKIWRARYAQINEFERVLTSNGVSLLKVLLHISREEQAQRLRARIEDPTKNWKFSAQDLEERRLWKSYMEAFEDAVNECGTPWAPWHVVPANRKWYRDAVVARLLREHLESLPLRYPKPSLDLSKIVIR
jgi:PPK2 family polyphosphate:nucleotide phosphotransferase